MTRPVRPVALVILTACMLYPGLTLLYQGFYPFFAGEFFNLVGQTGPWLAVAHRLGVPAVVVLVLQILLGAAWWGGVLGLWAGDPRAHPLALAAALGTLLCPGGPEVMAVLALACLLVFRERPDAVAA